jgi:hypothetical protein
LIGIGYLSYNPNAIHILEKNKNKINWKSLSINPNAIHMLEKNLDKINWDYLSLNPNAYYISCIENFNSRGQRCCLRFPNNVF